MNVEFALQEGIARIQELEAEINVKADWNMKAFERIEALSTAITLIDNVQDNDNPLDIDSRMEAAIKDAVELVGENNNA